MSREIVLHYRRDDPADQDDQRKGATGCRVCSDPGSSCPQTIDSRYPSCPANRRPFLCLARSCDDDKMGTAEDGIRRVAYHRPNCSFLSHSRACCRYHHIAAVMVQAGGGIYRSCSDNRPFFRMAWFCHTERRGTPEAEIGRLVHTPGIRSCCLVSPIGTFRRSPCSVAVMVTTPEFGFVWACALKCELD